MFGIVRFSSFLLFLIDFSHCSAKGYSDDLKNDGSYEVVELKGAQDVCQWVMKDLSSSSGELGVKYDWKSVNSDLLEFPKEYYGRIKYMEVDIGNDGKENILVKMDTYLGGTLSAINLLVLHNDFVFKFPVSPKSIFRDSIYSVKNDGRKRYLNLIKDLKNRNGNIFRDSKYLYGLSIYQPQSKFIEVFSYDKKNYVFIGPNISDETGIIGLVVSITRKDDGDFYSEDVCYLKN